MTSLLILNGPNLNMLGQRQPKIYGHMTLTDIRELCENKTKTLDMDLEFVQTNHEGQMVDLVQAAKTTHNGIILNAGAYTHTSIALFDALIAAEVPVIELHLSNVFSREAFRHHSYISKVAIGVICGFGAHGYLLAIDAMLEHLKTV
ncbi:MAG: type II 3-dehydroquinate dehydratase [Paracoccaceae bacterium]|jgi:3-dehydroquinate dehydratase II|nr:type II 3-dehydroquinate dehydratase [Paracoccaceae bacterium]